MARTGPALVAFGLLCILPTAGACSWALPEALSTLQPAGDALAANGAYESGGLLALNGTYTPVVTIGPQTMAWAASPDGRWFASAYGAPVDEPQGGIHGYSTCWMPLGVTEVVDVEHGTRVRLLDGAAHALAFGNGSLAVAAHDGLFVYATGAWTDPERADLPFASKDVRTMAWSGNGLVLALASFDGRVAVRGGLLDQAPWGDDARLTGLALDADGRRLAAVVDGRVHTADVSTGRWLRDVDPGFPARVVAWRSPWLAVAGGDAGDPETDADDVTEVLVVPDGWAAAPAPPHDTPSGLAPDAAWVEKRATLAGRAGGVAWLADGRLAVAAGGEIAILDEALDVASRSPVRPAADEPAFRPTDLNAERGPPREAPAGGVVFAVVAFALAFAFARRREGPIKPA